MINWALGLGLSIFAGFSLFGGAVANAGPHHYTLVTLQKNFETFWQAAKQKPFDQQIALWNQTVEAPYQNFYDGLVWSKATTPDWAARKKERLKDLFSEYPKLYPQIIANFSRFQTTLDEQIKKFQDETPEAQFNLSIFAAPSATFNGKAGDDGGAKNSGHKTVLAFGMDVMAERHDNADVLYSHELFHIYHSQLLKMSATDYRDKAHLTLPLWLEGIATFASGKFNPQAPDSSLLMDDALARLSPAQVTLLARGFLKVAQRPAQDPKDPITYLKWFSQGGYQLSKNLPSRCGYRLGLEVVRTLSKNYNLDQMAHWQLDEIDAKVIETLKVLASENGAMANAL